MDPYLEAPTEWPALHHLLISAVTELLQVQLKSRGYYAVPGERVWLTQPRRAIYSDVSAFRVARPHPNSESELATQAVAVLVDEPVRIERFEVEMREPYIDIVDGRGSQLITGIEILSPANKDEGHGRDLYLKTQHELAEAGVNLVEIDLLHEGEHVLDVPLGVLDDLPPWAYLINIVRVGGRDYEIYPVALPDRLPRIRIPLKAGDEDAVLDLQAAFEHAWERGPWPERIRYDEPPPGDWPEEELSWINERLIQSGWRSLVT